VFHDRDSYFNQTAHLLLQPNSARLAFVGPNGAGKTAVATQLLHDPRIQKRFDRLLYLSCEALPNTDAVIGNLAILLGVPPAAGIRQAVIAELSKGKRTLLVLDDVDANWDRDDRTERDTIPKFFGSHAMAHSLSLVVTTTGDYLPESVQWSNTNLTYLRRFSRESTTTLLEITAERRMTREEKDIATPLLDVFDGMPLAVTLFAQLMRLGHSVPKLIDRWNRDKVEHKTKLSGVETGLETSMNLSISFLLSTSGGLEAMQLLSMCSMLPDGLQAGVFDRIRPAFKSISRARDTLLAYAFVSIGAHGAVKAPVEIRNFIRKHHPAQPAQREALYSIYFDIASQLPSDTKDDFMQRSAVAMPEMWNLRSLLIEVVAQPSHEVVTAVIYFTDFWYQLWIPMLELPVALCPHIEQHRQWEQVCVRAIHRSWLRKIDSDPFYNPVLKYLWYYLGRSCHDIANGFGGFIRLA